MSECFDILHDRDEGHFFCDIGLLGFSGENGFIKSLKNFPNRPYCRADRFSGGLITSLSSYALDTWWHLHRSNYSEKLPRPGVGGHRVFSGEHPA